MFSLTIRMMLVLGALFGILYVVVALVGGGTLYANLVIAGIILLIQYLISPYIVQWSMRVRYVSEEEEPELHRIVGELAEKAGIPKPKVGISDIPIANAFAFGRSIRDGRVVVTREIMNMLDRNELTAVLGHEIGHIRNRDMVITTLVSVIPMILYNLYLMFAFGNSENRGSGAALAILFLILYFISNLLVLAVSRIREYLADYTSVTLGNSPEYLASALYKLVYNSARKSEEELATVSNIKAFFLNDPNVAYNEIRELAQLDTNRNFRIDRSELEMLKNARVKISFGERILELMTTHPNMLKRIKKLSEYIG